LILIANRGITMKKRYYIKKDDTYNRVWDRTWDKAVCLCYSQSDTKKIAKALNSLDTKIKS
jgi:hypothetical protein